MTQERRNMVSCAGGWNGQGLLFDNISRESMYVNAWSIRSDGIWSVLLRKFSSFRSLSAKWRTRISTVEEHFLFGFYFTSFYFSFYLFFSFFFLLHGWFVFGISFLNADLLLSSLIFELYVVCWLALCVARVRKQKYISNVNLNGWNGIWSRLSEPTTKRHPL